MSGVRDKLRHDDSDRVLPIGDRVALEWGRLAAERRSSMADGLIATTTTAVFSKVLVTHSVGDSRYSHSSDQSVGAVISLEANHFDAAGSFGISSKKSFTLLNY